MCPNVLTRTTVGTGGGVVGWRLIAEGGVGPVIIVLMLPISDDYAGVVVYVRVVDGLLTVGQKIRLMAGGTEHEVISLGRSMDGTAR